MKKESTIFIITFISIFFLSCLSPQFQAERAWSDDYSNDIYYYFSPKLFKTSGEAISTIKYLQASMTRDSEILDFQLDQYGFIIKSRLDRETTTYEVQPVTVSGFANSNLSSYYSNTTYVGKNVTSYSSSINITAVIFKNISSMTLDNTKINENWRWYVNISMNNDAETISICVKDKQAALNLINAIFTLARSNEKPIRTDVLGIGMSIISPYKANTLGLNEQKGLVISMLFTDGPAEKNGLMKNDVITHIDGNPVSTYDDYYKHVNNKSKNKIKLSLIRKTDFNSERGVFNYEQLEKSIVLK